MTTTIVPGNILDGVNASRSAIRTQFTNAANDVNALEAPQYVTLVSSPTIPNQRTLTGTSNQITLTDGGAGAAVTLTLSTNPVLPGTASMTVPIGSVAQRPGTPVNGMIRYNSDNSVLEGYIAGSWQTIAPGSGGGGVSSLNSLTGALSIAVGTTGTAFNVSASGSTITLNLPDASATADGTVNTTTQTFAGVKSFGTQGYAPEATLTDGSTIAWNTNGAQTAHVTIAGNRTLSSATNMVGGGCYVLRVTQDATGSRTLSYGTNYKFGAIGAPTLSTAPNKTDIITWYSDGTNLYYTGISQGF